MLSHKQFALTLSSNYQRSAFRVNVDSDIAELAQKFDVIHEQMMSELAMAIGLFDRVAPGSVFEDTLASLFDDNPDDRTLALLNAEG